MNLDNDDRSTDEVRQGETGHGVRYMLIVGIALAVVALGLSFMVAR